MCVCVCEHICMFALRWLAAALSQIAEDVLAKALRCLLPSTPSRGSRALLTCTRLQVLTAHTPTHTHTHTHTHTDTHTHTHTHTDTDTHTHRHRHRHIHTHTHTHIHT